MTYAIRTRKFIPREGYAPWTTEFDGIDSMEKAVRCARAHFTLLSEFDRLDQDICETMIATCETWLSLDSDTRPDRMFTGWAERFHVEIGNFGV